jgi:phosphatidylglycerol:prolipoprotein diacylglycerol transferase
MHPVLFQVFELKIYSYGVLVALAFVAGFALIVRRAAQAGENPDSYLEAAIWFIIAGIGGARLFYFLWFPQVFFRDPLGALFSSGGLVWYGGVIGVLLAILLYTRLKKLNLFHFTDIVSPAAALGLAIGRIGCLLAGCCYGSPCDLPWAIRYPHTHETLGLPVHPAPLYETVLMLGVTLVLLALERYQATRRKLFNGFTTGWFFILAGLVRFAVEAVRGDRLVWFALGGLELSASQAVSLLGVLAGTLLLTLRPHFVKSPVHYP